MARKVLKKKVQAVKGDGKVSINLNLKVTGTPDRFSNFDWGCGAEVSVQPGETTDQALGRCNELALSFMDRKINGTTEELMAFIRKVKDGER